MAYQSYIVKQRDTIEGIASSQLGDASQWTQVVALNNLRYPYISDNPADQYGTALYQTTLTKNYNGGLFLYVSSIDQTILFERDVVYLSGSGGILDLPFSDAGSLLGWGYPSKNGQMIWSQSMINDFSPFGLSTLGIGNILYITTDLNHSYASGTQVSLYHDPSENLTRVLKTGDTLYLPIAAVTNGSVDFNSTFGTDIMIDKNGFLFLDQTTRDLETVDGPNNLAQSLTIRLKTELGTLPYHPEYGNGILQYLGSSIGSLSAIAYSTISQAILNDQRVSSIRGLNVSIQGDTVIASALISVANEATLMTISNIIIAGS